MIKHPFKYVNQQTFGICRLHIKKFVEWFLEKQMLKWQYKT